MRILVVNDDGVDAIGIKHLARLAADFGEVWVVAPDRQCSAMSHRITVHKDLVVKKISDTETTHVYSVSGTPADCVKVAVRYLMPERPDIVFSGINDGVNAGVDILYSGTIGACMEALIQGIPAIAFSIKRGGSFEVVEHYFEGIVKELLQKEIASNEIWNVNFPGCQMGEEEGILWNRVPAKTGLIDTGYKQVSQKEKEIILETTDIHISTAKEGTDLHAILHDYISIGIVKNNCL